MMTEPTPTAPEATHIPATSTNAAGPRADAEPRSFHPAETAARRAADTGKTAAQAAADNSQAAAHALNAGGQRLVEAGRTTSNEMADLFRASLDSFSAMQAEFRQMFEDSWRRATGMSFSSPMLMAQPFAARTPAIFGQPAADVREGQDAYTIAVELPGLKREDVELFVRDNLVTICGHKTDETERAGGAYHVSERRFGRFERSFAVPHDVDRTRIEAGFREGVLTVRLPRTADAPKQNWKIEVKGAA